MENLCLRAGIHGVTASISMNVGGGDGCIAKVRPPASKINAPSLISRFSFKFPLRYLWPGGEQRCRTTVNDAVLMEKSERIFDDGVGKLVKAEDGAENWILQFLSAKSLPELEKEKVGDIFDNDDDDEKLGKKDEINIAVNNNDDDDNDDDDENLGMKNTISIAVNNDDDDDENCDLCKVDVDDEEAEQEIKFDRHLFSSLLKKVSMADAKLYAKLSYLGNLTYSISKIQPENLLRYYNLRFITSSLEKKEKLAKPEKAPVTGKLQKPEESKKEPEEDDQKISGHQISTSAAYQIAASAASYLHSQTKSILPFNSSDNKSIDDSSKDENVPNESIDMNHMMNSEMATFISNKDDVKQVIADDLNSIFSSPCEWFICDDDHSTRFFVIQGSESLASWQANLLFEPVPFEGLDILVHRGIYEASIQIYEHMLHEIHAHLKTHGSRAKFRFTGHSLGGSLALLVNLMLLIRSEVPKSSLLPVVAYGAPYVMCGGDHLLRKLGLPKNHFQAIAMHRDIVPRVFSALLSNHIVEFFKAVNGKFRSHPCLKNQKSLFAPMGELLILQPDDKFSPHHHLLPRGTGLYRLSSPKSIPINTEEQKLIQSATKVFLNSPHPLEILSDRSAYGSEGTIVRDHDMNSYLKSIRSVIRQDLNRIRKARRAHRRKTWWPVVLARKQSGEEVKLSGDNVGPQTELNGNTGKGPFNVTSILRTGRNSLEQFGRVFASRNMHLVLVLFPARLVIFETVKVTTSIY